LPETKNSVAYELAVVLRPTLAADSKAGVDKIAKIIKDAKGEVSQDAKYERRELAYKIKGETHGLYGFYRLELPSDAPDKITSILNITDEVLRYLLTKVDVRVEAYLAEEAERRRERNSAREDDEKSDEA
jgi:ribosomal protein S6